MATTFPDRQRTLGSLLRLPYQAMQDTVYGALAERGFDDIRAAHSAVFRHIDADGTRLTVLAERAGMTKQSMAYLVDALSQAGYLATTPDPHDGRARRVRLTRRGEQAMTALLELSADFEQRLAARLGVARMKRLRTLLEELATVVEPVRAADTP
ncbi:MarR family winged helix-turn-helix transcriptional regulator [Dyella ginsengisoli]|uniref:MarR family winged helix-turn-helix transcriptional regulator n=1 Tax=Dyella ginsengisoli TaxID=363848 RepID=UPI000346FD82|nr:MarR family winged helix-turn-helix transcriptional regulator [Dyella ginsengisoli]